jgi:hypothetical protein
MPNDRSTDSSNRRLGPIRQGSYGSGRSSGHIGLTLARKQRIEGSRYRESITRATAQQGLSGGIPKISRHIQRLRGAISGHFPMIKDFFNMFTKLKEEAMQDRAERSRDLDNLKGIIEDEDETVERINAIVVDIKSKKNNG